MNYANAAQVTAIYETTFDGGHRAEGTIIYDDAIPIVSGFGLGAANGIEFLDVTFFDPGNSELFSVVDVTGGVSSYFFLTTEFDTTTPNFLLGSPFDIGEDTGTLGEFFMSGSIGGASNLFDVPALNVIDTANPTTFTVSIIPEPSGLVVGLIGFLLMPFRRILR